jgi:hypothetical protein
MSTKISSTIRPPAQAAFLDWDLDVVMTADPAA